MNRYSKYMLVFLVLYDFHIIQSWWGENAFNKVQQEVKNVSHDELQKVQQEVQNVSHNELHKAEQEVQNVSHDVKKAKNKVTGQVPVFLYYWPKLDLKNLVLGINDMSIKVGSDNFIIVNNGDFKYPALFTRFTKLFGSSSSLSEYKASQQKKGFYLKFTYDKFSKKITVTANDSLIFIKNLDIGSVVFSLNSSKSPKKITVTINGKHKTFSINKILYVLGFK